MLKGALPVGTIVYLQDGVRPMGVSRFWQPAFRNPWQIVAWHPRRYERPFLPPLSLRGGHLATVRSLRDGRVQLVADWLLKFCTEL